MAIQKTLKSDKKGITQADWAISLGIFILYLSVVFLLVRPLLDNATQKSPETDSIELFLRENTTSPFHTTPITTEQKTVPIMFTQIDITEYAEQLQSSAASLSSKTSGKPFDYYIIHGHLVAFLDTTETEFSLTYPKERDNRDSIATYHRTNATYDLVSDENDAEIADKQIEYSITDQTITQLTHQGNAIITDWDSERNGEEINTVNDSYTQGTFFASYQGIIPKYTSSPEPNEHYRQTRTQLIFANTTTATRLYSKTSESIDMDETGGTIPQHTYTETLTLTNVTTFETSSESIEFTEICHNQTTNQFGLTSSQETISFSSPDEYNVTVCNTNGTTTLSIVKQQKITEPWLLSITLSDTGFETENTVMTGTPHLKQKQDLLDLSKYTRLQTRGYQSIKDRLRLHYNEDVRIEIHVPPTDNLTTIADMPNPFTETLFVFGPNLSKTEEITSSSRLAPLITTNNTTAVYPFAKQIIYRW